MPSSTWARLVACWSYLHGLRSETVCLVARKASALWSNNISKHHGDMPSSNFRIGHFQLACPVIIHFSTPSCNGCTRAEARETTRCLGPRSPLPVTGSLLSLHSTPSLTHPTVPSTAAHGVLASPPPSAPAPMDPAAGPMVTRSNADAHHPRVRGR
jgi:hypothetical protein